MVIFELEAEQSIRLLGTGFVERVSARFDSELAYSRSSRFLLTLDQKVLVTQQL